MIKITCEETTLPLWGGASCKVWYQLGKKQYYGVALDLRCGFRFIRFGGGLCSEVLPAKLSGVLDDTTFWFREIEFSEKRHAAVVLKYSLFPEDHSYYERSEYWYRSRIERFKSAKLNKLSLNDRRELIRTAIEQNISLKRAQSKFLGIE